MTIYVFATRLTLALLLGTLIGLEREWRQRMAGTRTNALVAGGAAAFAMAGTLIPGDVAAQARLVAYIVSGRGILRRRSDFQGQRSNQRIESTSPPAGMTIGLTWSTV